MQEPSFEQLVQDAAAGLKADAEVYRDVTQELHGFLEDKAEQFRNEGHDDAESIALATKAFGSPLEVAAELLDANRRRMKLRAAFRLAFGALIVPLVVLLALYLGYGRFARVLNMTNMMSDGGGNILPTLPLLGTDDVVTTKTNRTFPFPSESMQNAPAFLRYWQTHRNEPDSYQYYAYYARFAGGESWQQQRDPIKYARIMHEGERIEPDNVLYNLLLAEYYLRVGMIASSEQAVSDSDRIERMKRDKGWGDEIYDRQDFALGLAELRKGVAKPYLRTYVAEINRKWLGALPSPLLTEDYQTRALITCSILLPQFSRYRTLARKISGCARLLHKEGHTQEAEAIMDTWKPYARLVAHDPQFLLGALVANEISIELSQESVDFYQQIGAHAKARQAQALAAQLANVKTEWRASRFNATSNDMLRQHGSILAAIIVPNYGSNRLMGQEFTASRMHEHVMVESFGIGLLQILFALLLLGTVVQGFIWHFRLRGAASVPLLLLPPVREIIRVLWWGVALPLLLYWIYSRLPVIGGREYGWGYHWWRFATEFVLLGLLVLWLPARMINRYVRRRCDELGIVPPTRREEFSANVMVKVAGIILLALCIIAVIVVRRIHFDVPLSWSFSGLLLALAGTLAYIHFSGKVRREWALRYGLAAIFTAFLECYLLTTPYFLPVTGAIVAVGMLWIALRYTNNIRGRHGLYYGTLARSMAPLYAFAILLLAFTAQPWLLYQEATWLQRDTLIFSHQVTSDSMISFTGLESRVTHDFTRRLLRVLERE